MSLSGSASPGACGWSGGSAGCVCASACVTSASVTAKRRSSLCHIVTPFIEPPHAGEVLPLDRRTKTTRLKLKGEHSGYHATVGCQVEARNHRADSHGANPLAQQPMISNSSRQSRFV